MTLLSHVMRRLGFPDTRQPDVTDQARSAVDQIKETTAELDERLKPYLRACDPFAAMVGDMYNLGQVSRIYKGDQQ